MDSLTDCPRRARCVVYGARGSTGGRILMPVHIRRHARRTRCLPLITSNITKEVTLDESSKKNSGEKIPEEAPEDA